MLGSIFKASAVAGIIATVMKSHLEFNRLAEKWRPAINRFAKENGVSRYVLAAILWQESKFNPDAIGSLSERGMGQFREIAAADVQVDFEQLVRSPELQIESSAKLLALTTKRLHGDVFSAVRAYNVGIGNATENSTSGAGYALEVFKNALIDWVFGVFGGESE